MITIETLKAYGADIDEGLARCMGMEEFYLQLVGTMLEDANFAKLDAAVEAKDAKAGFEAAHALHESMGCIAFENHDMGIYFITDPDGYWLEILPPIDEEA